MASFSSGLKNHASLLVQLWSNLAPVYEDQTQCAMRPRERGIFNQDHTECGFIRANLMTHGSSKSRWVLRFGSEGGAYVLTRTEMIQSNWNVSAFL